MQDRRLHVVDVDGVGCDVPGIVVGRPVNRARFDAAPREPPTVRLAEVIPALRHYGLGLIPWSPLAGGLLGGVLKRAEEGRRGGAGIPGIPQRAEQLRPQLEAWEAFCEELGEQPVSDKKVRRARREVGQAPENPTGASAAAGPAAETRPAP